MLLIFFLQEKINREILNSKVFNMDNMAANGGGSNSNSGGGGNGKRKRKRKNQRAVNGMLADVADAGPYATNGNNNVQDTSGGSNGAGGGGGLAGGTGKWKNGIAAKARSLMNLHNNEAGRRVSCFVNHLPQENNM